VSAMQEGNVAEEKALARRLPKISTEDKS